ncbi:MAG: hypothetical protein IJS40_02760 [Synergistaceae bacterium]|nr:hypothetical protein [Synergistaceae bacterium]
MNETTLTKSKAYPLTTEEYEEWEPVFDDAGNPTQSTLMAFYESEHDIGETVTLEEMQDWINSL